MVLDLGMSFEEYAYTCWVLCFEGCNDGMEMHLYHHEVQKRIFTVKVISCLENDTKKKCFDGGGRDGG